MLNVYTLTGWTYIYVRVKDGRVSLEVVVGWTGRF